MHRVAIKYQISKSGLYRFCWMGDGTAWIPSGLRCQSRQHVEDEARRFCESNNYECDLFNSDWEDCE